MKILMYVMHLFGILCYCSSSQMYKDIMNGRAKKNAKLEKKLKIKLGGYMVRLYGVHMIGLDT